MELVLDRSESPRFELGFLARGFGAEPSDVVFALTDDRVALVDRPSETCHLVLELGPAHALVDSAHERHAPAEVRSSSAGATSTEVGEGVDVLIVNGCCC